MIEAKKIAKVYGKGDIAVKALNNISLNIREGEFLAIMGPSGSGKSTLMNILGCLDTPSSGQYILGGTDVSKMNDKQLAHIRNRKIGFIFQTFNLLPGLSAIKNVEQPMLYSGIRKKERFKIAREALESVGLGNRIDHKPSELSGGQRQRVAIARSFVNDPAILLADEPTGNLDTNSEDEILSILTGLNNKGITIIMVTHDRRVAGYAHRIINFRDGIITGEEMTGNKFSPCSTVSGGGKGETG